MIEVYVSQRNKNFYFIINDKIYVRRHIQVNPSLKQSILFKNLIQFKSDKKLTILLKFEE